MNKNKKILLISIILLLILSTVSFYKVLATDIVATVGNESLKSIETVEDDEFVRANIISRFVPDYDWNGEAITFQTLTNYRAVMCCARGVTIPSGLYNAFFSGVATEAPEDYQGEGTYYESASIPGLNPENAANGSILGNNSNYFVALPEGADPYTYDYGNPFGASSYKSQGKATYKVLGSYIATPEEAFIIANLGSEGDALYNNGIAENAKYYSEQQKAWWLTPAGSEGGNVGTNALHEAAIDFQEYITKATDAIEEITLKTVETVVESDENKSATSAKRKNTKKWETQEYKLKTDDGEEITVEGFKLKDPSWVEEGNVYNTDSETTDSFKTPTVSYNANTGKYQIGPFKIDYVSYVGRDGKQYSGIEKMELYTDASEEPMVLEEGSKWSIMHTDISTSTDKKIVSITKIDKEAPKANETFYIELDDIANATKITDFKVYFKYTNAAGSYKKLGGTYSDITWKVKSELRSDENGTITGKQYWMEATIENKKTQTTTEIEDTAYIWEQYSEINRTFTIKSAKIQIEKKLVYVDANGVEHNVDLEDLKDIDENYKFNLKVTGALNKEGTEPPIVVSAKRGVQSSKVYYWLDEENVDSSNYEVPTFELVEQTPENGATFLRAEMYDSNGFTPISVQNGRITGELNQEGTIKIVVTNKIDSQKYGYLKIRKEIIRPEDIPDDIYRELLDRDYAFTVKLSGDFYYGGNHYVTNGKTYDSSAITEPLVISNVTIKATQKDSNDESRTWIINEPIKWLGNTAPTYEVIEEKDLSNQTKPSALDKQNATTDGIYNKKGSLVGTEEPTPITTDNTTNVVKLDFENDPTKRYGNLKIIKVLENYNNISEEIIDTYEFKFKVLIDDKVVAEPVLSKKDYEKTEENGVTVYTWTWESEKYGWYGADDKGPTYSIEEIEMSTGVDFANIENDEKATVDLGNKNVTGNLRTEPNVEVFTIENKFINRVNHESGNLKIVKTIGEKDKDDLSKQTLIGTTFKFNVDIKGEFSYKDAAGNEIIPYGKHNIRLTNDGYINLEEDGTPNKNDIDKKVLITPELANDGINYKDNTNIWLSGEFSWVKGFAPTYSVEEDLTALAEVIDTCPTANKEGRLAGSNEIIVEINNRVPEPDNKYGKISIDKILTGAENYTPDEIKALEFKFKLVVMSNPINGESEVLTNRDEKDPIVLKCETQGDGSYVWSWESDTYVWDAKKYNEPTYTLEEIEIPEGITFDYGYVKVNDEVIPDTPDAEYKVNGKTITGKIVANSDKTQIATTKNYYVNKLDAKPLVSYLRLTKTIDNNADLKGKTYSFKVKINGKFQYNEMQYDGEYYLSNNGISTDANSRVTITFQNDDLTCEWKSSDFKWKANDEAPTYSVEEDAVSINNRRVTAQITNPTGKLTEKIGDAVNVYIKNTIEEKKGQIKIFKTLDTTGLDLNDEEVKKHIDSLDFHFAVKVDGYTEPIDVQLERKDGYTWEKAIEVSLQEGTTNYSVTEINVPDGTIFKEFSGGNGSISEDGKTYYGTLNQNGDTAEITCKNEFIGRTNEAKLEIEKQIDSSSLKGKEFKFNITLKGTFEYDGKKYVNEELVLNDVVVKGGESWKSKTIFWSSIMSNPTYVVEEQESDIATVESITNATGTITEGSTVLVIAKNQARRTGGYIKVTKQLSDGQIASLTDKFTFRVTVDDKVIATPTILANETWTSDRIVWDVAESAPNYKVEEINIPTGYIARDISNSEGTIKESNSVDDAEVVHVVATNTREEENGYIKIRKEIVADSKLLDPENPAEFTIKAQITGTFEITDGENAGKFVDNGTETITFTLKAGEIKTIGLKWYKNNAPIIKVIETEIPKGWTNTGISNNDIEVYDGMEIVVTNELPTYTKIKLTMDLGGQVWHDVAQDPSSKNEEDSEPNGLIDGNEDGVSGVEVYVYTGGQLAELRDDLGGTIKQPILTNASGEWQAKGVSIPKVVAENYNIEFVYDGQTYEPTKYLVTGNSNSSAYKNASTGSGRDSFFNDSMALDYNRAEVDNRIAKVEGDSPLDGSGNTVGTVVSSDGVVRKISYTSNANMSKAAREGDLQNDTIRVVSNLVTRNEDGTVIDIFKAKARTYSENTAANLQYPFDTAMHLESFDRYLAEEGMVSEYKYSATYNYMLHINLGLVDREEADLGTSKDLIDAKVVVNNKLVTYTFNKLSDMGKDILSRKIDMLNDFDTQTDNANIEYELGLYKTDYYYRAELYKANENYDAVEKLYKSLGTTFDDTEMEVYLKYKISLFNESPSYDVVINSLNDYYDSSFGEPLKDVEKYLETKDGEVVNGIVKVTEVSTITKPDGSKSEVNWQLTDSNIIGSDNKTYNKLNANFNDVKLASGESAEIYVTFAVKKDTVQAVRDAIKLGNKSNIAEIASYTTYYDGTNIIAGKVDKDSAPDNVNIKNYNERLWYEDDTYASPVLNLELSGVEDTKTVQGLSWEDRDGVGTEGVYDENDEALIGGLTTQLVEKVTVNEKDYDFIWPTNEPLNSLGGKTLESLTGFDSTVETSRIAGNVGQYKFDGIPTGNYIVRFLYGIDKSTLDDTDNLTGNPTALKADGTSFASDNGGYVLTANYDNDKTGLTSAVYNGQDYKTTIYQVGNTTEGAVLTNVTHNMESYNNSDKDSDARDNEVRRLQITANSTTLTNSNTSVLAEANNKDGNHSELYADYSMFADTAKISVNEGEIANIHVGLVERPETNIVLDKEISSIKIVTNDNKVIFDAEYNISFEESNDANNKNIIARLSNGKYLYAKVELATDRSVNIEVLQALNKIENKLTYNNEENGGTQNFRFINVDDTILQGSTIDINYKLYAINVGESDSTSSELAELSGNADAKKSILRLANQLANSNNVEIGRYVGTEYYTGRKAETDKVVTTRVRQVVDYVDNDATFTSGYNAAQDSSWRNTSITELKGNGLTDKQLIDESIAETYTLADKNGVSYITEQRNNVILSIDELSTNGELNNSGFEKELIPYVANAQDNSGAISEINLRVTRTISAESDADNLTYDNLAEIVKYENTFGRRDTATISGSTNPKLGEFIPAIEERDSSATELITFTPPTGSEADSALTAQILIVTAIAIAIVIVGIVIIKKKLTV